MPKSICAKLWERDLINLLQKARCSNIRKMATIILDFGLGITAFSFRKSVFLKKVDFFKVFSVLTRGKSLLEPCGTTFLPD